MNKLKENFLPLSLTAFVILADQFVKALIVKIKPETGLIWPKEGTLSITELNDRFLWIYHVRNKAIAFSMGERLPESIKPIIFILVPILVLGFLLWYYFKSDEFSFVQRWAAAGIIGGGLGNIIDRIFRPDGVVDFISVKFYNIFGMQRWPTFNIADSSVVVCSILLFITIFIGTKKTESGNAAESKLKKEETNE